MRSLDLGEPNNCRMPALASQDPTTQPKNTTPPAAAMPLMQRLVKLMGLAPDATEEALMDALQAMLKGAAKPDPKDCMPVAAVTAMMRERGEERLALEAGRATEKVNAALRQGEIGRASCRERV